MKDNGVAVKLVKIWEHLDQACGNLEHAIELIEKTNGIAFEVKNEARAFECPSILSLKKSIEDELIKNSGTSLLESIRIEGDCKK